MAEKRRQVSEEEARQVAEASREKEWKSPSFLKELFLGNFRLDLVHPYPRVEEDRPEFAAFYAAFREFLKSEVDPVAIDESGEYPPHVLDGLRKLGAFGLKIPKEYGGLGFNMLEYSKLMELLGSVDGNVEALLSAHQSIGVPTPLLYFGTEEQKRRFLPRCAAGEISGFALTEPDVGSDPARLATTAELSEDGTHYVLNGTKLWCTNGTISKLLVVMARDPQDQEDLGVRRRVRLAGNEGRAPLSLHGHAGAGQRRALVHRRAGAGREPHRRRGQGPAHRAHHAQHRPARHPGGDGRRQQALSRDLPAVVERARAVGAPDRQARGDLAPARRHGGDHFAEESMTELACQMADRGGYDIRLEAAAAKLWNTEKTWQIVDDTMQIRGGRGYETASSLAARGDDPVPVELVFRDCRINRIFEGSSEIMRLFMAREAVDKHLEVAGDIIDARKPAGARGRAFLRAALFYLWWYPTRWLGWGRWPRYAEFGPLAGHLRFVDRKARKLARQVFHGMLVHRGKLQVKQGFLFRLMDITCELFAMSAAVSRAQFLARTGKPEAERARELADLFCRGSRRDVERLFRELWSNDDVLKYRRGVATLDGKYAFLHEGTLSVGMHKVRGRDQGSETVEPAGVPVDDGVRAVLVPRRATLASASASGLTRSPERARSCSPCTRRR
jgi:alkylation response protein AidB-like acyl-CoA dehydrogenase